MGVYGTRFTGEIIAPNPVEQLLAGKYLAGIGGQHIEDFNFLGRTDDGFAAQGNRIAFDIDHQLLVNHAAVVRALLLLACAAQHRLNPRHHFPWAEGFDDIVVRPQFKAQDPVYLLPLCREHDDGYPGRFANFLANVYPAHGRHHNIQHAKGNIAI
ncbi:hypothetical protein SDC9_177977 [bioreactor metagenome]|uniref:Uncharacterized protein n=1 Tax=bioreactor metagenome TaxID=1076179 RepID=A0A645GW65_9ZZZZ